MHNLNSAHPAQHAGQGADANAGIASGVWPAQHEQFKAREDAVASRLGAANARLAELQMRLSEALDEARYVRRRAEADLEHARRFAIEDMAKALLPFKDALETALAIETSDAGALRAGLELTRKQLLAVLERPM